MLAPSLEVALRPGEPGCAFERLRAQQRLRPAVSLERRLDPGPSFAEVAAHPPESPDAADQLQQPLRLV
jgi:hypothetical protein